MTKFLEVIAQLIGNQMVLGNQMIRLSYTLSLKRPSMSNIKTRNKLCIMLIHSCFGLAMISYSTINAIITAAVIATLELLTRLLMVWFKEVKMQIITWLDLIVLQSRRLKSSRSLPKNDFDNFL